MCAHVHARICMCPHARARAHTHTHTHALVHVKLKVCCQCSHLVGTQGTEEVKLHSFFTSTIDGDEWSTAHPGCFTLGKNPGTHSLRGWFGPTVGLAIAEERKI